MQKKKVDLLSQTCKVGIHSVELVGFCCIKPCERLTGIHKKPVGVVGELLCYSCCWESHLQQHNKYETTLSYSTAISPSSSS